MNSPEKAILFTQIENICSMYSEDIDSASDQLINSGFDPEILEDHLENLYPRGIYKYDLEVIDIIVEAQTNKEN